MLNSMKWSPQYSVLVALLVSFAACAAYIGTRASDGETTWRPGAKHWDRVPVCVYFSDFGGVSGHAIKMWNDAAGCTVLTKTTSRSEADIVVKATDGTPCGVAGAPGMLPDHAGGGVRLLLGLVVLVVLEVVVDKNVDVLVDDGCGAA